MADPFQSSYAFGLSQINGVSDTLNQRKAGAMLGSGNYAGAADTLFNAGDLKGGMALQDRGAKAQADNKLEQLDFTLKTARALKDVRSAGGNVLEAFQSLTPVMRQMGVDQNQIQELGTLIQSDPQAIDRIEQYAGAERAKYTYQKAGDRLLEFQEGKQGPVGSYDAPEKPIAVGAGSRLVNPTTGETLLDAAPETGKWVERTLPDGSTEWFQLPASGSAPSASSGAAGSVTSNSAPRSVRNNNPGNIEDGPFAKSLPGYKGSDGRFAIFETPDAGGNAQVALLESYGKRGFDTVGEIINRWAPPTDNNPTSAYVNYVARQMGVRPDEPLNMANRETLSKLAGAIKQFEGGSQSPSNGTPPVPAQAGGIQGNAPKDRYRNATPEEIAAAGLPPGTPAQISPQGQIQPFSNGANMKPVPQKVVEGITENRAALSKIDAAIAAIRANPKAMGAANYTPGPIRDRLDVGGVDVRAKLSGIGSQKIHDLSGAAVSASEFPRLRPYVPLVTDRADVAIKKLENFKTEVEAILNETEGVYGPDSGYRPLNPDPARVSSAPAKATDTASKPAAIPAQIWDTASTGQRNWWSANKISGSMGAKTNPRRINPNDATGSYANVRKGEYFITPSGEVRGPKP